MFILFVKFKSNFCFLFFKLVISKGKSCLQNLNQILYFDFFFTCSHSSLIVLNRPGLPNTIPAHDDENRVEFFNRAHCPRHPNRTNPSLAMLQTQHSYQMDHLIDSLFYTANTNPRIKFYGYCAIQP